MDQSELIIFKNLTFRYDYNGRPVVIQSGSDSFLRTHPYYCDTRNFYGRLYRYIPISDECEFNEIWIKDLGTDLIDNFANLQMLKSLIFQGKDMKVVYENFEASTEEETVCNPFNFEKPKGDVFIEVLSVTERAEILYQNITKINMPQNFLGYVFTPTGTFAIFYCCGKEEGNIIRQSLIELHSHPADRKDRPKSDGLCAAMLQNMESHIPLLYLDSRQRYPRIRIKVQNYKWAEREIVIRNNAIYSSW